MHRPDPLKPPAGFSGDGRLLAGASRAGYAKLWQFPSCDEITTLSGLYGMHSVAFAPAGARLAIGCGRPEVVRLCDIESHQLVLALGVGRGVFLATAFSPDGTTLGSASHEGQLHLWRAPSREEIEAADKSAAEVRNVP
jgi:WD40 repeat protein